MPLVPNQLTICWNPQDKGQEFKLACDVFVAKMANLLEQIGP